MTRPRLRSLLFAALFTTPLFAADPYQPHYTRLAPDQLDKLTAPVALYPDPLLAQVLAASTYPLEIVTASQWLRATPRPTENAINAQPWEPAVQALAHYPAALHRLANNIASTQQLGQAYLNQPSDVMASVQRLRHRALAAGTLRSNAQYTVVGLGDNLEILPATPDVIYVPAYDPSAAYDRGTTLGYDSPYAVGPWLTYDTDWADGCVVTDTRWDREHWDRHRHPGRTSDSGNNNDNPTIGDDSTPSNRFHSGIAPPRPAPAAVVVKTPERRWSPNPAKVPQPMPRFEIQPVAPATADATLPPTPLYPARTLPREAVTPRPQAQYRVDPAAVAPSSADAAPSPSAPVPAYRPADIAPAAVQPAPVAAPTPSPAASPAPAPAPAPAPVSRESSNSSDQSAQSSSSQREQPGRSSVNR